MYCKSAKQQGGWFAFSLFVLYILGEKEILTSMTTCSTDSLKLTSSQATDFRLTQFSLLPTCTLAPDLERPTERNHALKPQEQVLVSLRECKQSRLSLPVSNPFKPLKDSVSFNNSKILSELGDGVFGGGPPPVFLCSLRNFDSSFFAVLYRFVHFSLTSATLQCAVPTAFTAIVISSHTLCLNLLVVVLVNFDFSTARFSSNSWVIIAASCTEKFGFRFLQAF